MKRLRSPFDATRFRILIVVAGRVMLIREFMVHTKRVYTSSHKPNKRAEFRPTGFCTQKGSKKGVSLNFLLFSNLKRGQSALPLFSFLERSHRRCIFTGRKGPVSCRWAIAKAFFVGLSGALHRSLPAVVVIARSAPNGRGCGLKVCGSIAKKVAERSVPFFGFIKRISSG
jgi:hypothetical protein